jgi:hypothetical protein
MIIFFVLLTIGFIFELGKKALTIYSRQNSIKITDSNIKRNNSDYNGSQMFSKSFNKKQIRTFSTSSKKYIKKRKREDEDEDDLNLPKRVKLTHENDNAEHHYGPINNVTPIETASTPFGGQFVKNCSQKPEENSKDLTSQDQESHSNPDLVEKENDSKQVSENEQYSDAESFSEDEYSDNGSTFKELDAEERYRRINILDELISNLSQLYAKIKGEDSEHTEKVENILSDCIDKLTSMRYSNDYEDEDKYTDLTVEAALTKQKFLTVFGPYFGFNSNNSSNDNNLLNKADNIQPSAVDPSSQPSVLGTTQPPVSDTTQPPVSDITQVPVSDTTQPPVSNTNESKADQNKSNFSLVDASIEKQESEMPS